MTTPAADTAKCTCPTFDGEQAISIACPVHGYPGYPTSLDGKATPADNPDKASAVDPGAIELDKLKTVMRNWPDSAQKEIYTRLIAAVEALRARIKIIKGNLESEAFFWKERAEAAEARVVELVGAVNALLKERSVNTLEEAAREYPHDKEDVAEVLAVFDNLRTVLAATPAEALERAKVVRAESYAAGLEAAAAYLDEVAAVTAADLSLTGKVWPIETAKAIRALGKEE